MSIELKAFAIGLALYVMSWLGLSTMFPDTYTADYYGRENYSQLLRSARRQTIGWLVLFCIIPLAINYREGFSDINIMILSAGLGIAVFYVHFIFVPDHRWRKNNT